MATIGLDRLYYAKITEDDNGDETYDTPMPLAKAVQNFPLSLLRPLFMPMMVPLKLSKNLKVVPLLSVLMI